MMYTSVLFALSVVLSAICSFALPLGQYETRGLEERHGFPVQQDILAHPTLNLPHPPSSDDNGIVEPLESGEPKKVAPVAQPDAPANGKATSVPKARSLERRSKAGNFFKKVGNWFKNNIGTIVDIGSKVAKFVKVRRSD